MTNKEEKSNTSTQIPILIDAAQLGQLRIKPGLTTTSTVGNLIFHLGEDYPAWDAPSISDRYPTPQRPLNTSSTNSNDVDEKALTPSGFLFLDRPSQVMASVLDVLLIN